MESIVNIPLPYSDNDSAMTFVVHIQQHDGGSSNWRYSNNVRLIR